MTSFRAKARAPMLYALQKLNLLSAAAFPQFGNAAACGGITGGMESVLKSAHFPRQGRLPAAIMAPGRLVDGP